MHTALACLPNTSSKLNVLEGSKKGPLYEFPCLTSSAFQIKQFVLFLRHITLDLLTPFRWKLQTGSPETETVYPSKTSGFQTGKKKEIILSVIIFDLSISESQVRQRSPANNMTHHVGVVSMSFPKFSACNAPVFFLCLLYSSEEKPLFAPEVVCLESRQSGSSFPGPDFGWTRPGPLNNTGHHHTCSRVSPQSGFKSGLVMKGLTHANSTVSHYVTYIPSLHLGTISQF